MSTISEKKILETKNAVNLLRRLSGGSKKFSAHAGYDLRRISTWSKQRFTATDRYLKELVIFYEQFPSVGYHWERLGKNQRKIINETMYTDKKPSWVAYDFIPNTPEGYKRKITRKGIEFIEKESGYKNGIIPIDVFDMLQNTEAFFNNLFSKYPNTAFLLMSNQHLFSLGKYNGGLIQTPEDGVELVTSLSNRYSTFSEWANYIRYYTAPDANLAADFLMDEVIAEDKERKQRKEKDKKDYRRYKRQQMKQGK